jgi:hypothetical protein
MKTHAEDSPIPALRAAEGAVRTDANTAPTTDQGASTFAGYEDERDLGVPPAPVHPATTIRSADAARYHIPPELAQELTWQDAYFADDDPDDGGGGENTSDGIVAVFDLDYDLMEKHWVKVGWTTYGTSIVLFPQLLWIDFLGLIPCYLRRNVRWSIRSQHVAVTRTGIRFVREKYPTCLGHSWTDVDHFERTVPFDAIDDCRITEPSGQTLLWIDNTLHTVHVDTRVKSAERPCAPHRPTAQRRAAELTISGLQNREAFRSLVLAMKAHQGT